MKKNKMMRIASVLLVAVLMSTCAISGTFAKYVTEATGSDSARVAKWGVTIDSEGVGSTFATAYTSNTDGIAYNTVEATEDVLAPGTAGTMATFELSGTPEVAVKVSYEADVTLNGWEVVGVTTYCPIIIKVNNTPYQIAMGTSATELENAVENAINGYTQNYAANQNLENVDSNMLTVSWEWPISVNDGADTALGNQAANGNAATIAIEITCTVEQVD